MKEKVGNWIKEAKRKISTVKRNESEVYAILAYVQNKVDEEAAIMAHDEFRLSVGDHVWKKIEIIKGHQDMSPVFIIHSFTLKEIKKEWRGWVLCANVIAQDRYINHCINHRDFNGNYKLCLPCKELIKTDKSIDEL